MTRLYQLLIVTTLFILQSCITNKAFVSYWNPNSNTNHFSQKEAIYYHPADELSIKVFNNREHIDIILATNSPLTLRKIYNLGLSIWIDPDGKSRNILAINYPMPIEFPYTKSQFKSYLTGFSRTEFQEELMDRFQNYEIVDTRSNETISLSTLNKEEDFKVELKTTDQILFSYHIRFPISEILTTDLNKKPVISIGVASVNEANEEYYSALSSKEYIRKRLEKLEAGTDQNPYELTEWWANFRLALTTNFTD